MRDLPRDILIEVMEDVIEDLHGHVHRVADLAVDLGTGLGLPEEDLDRLALAGVLHDVGKIHLDPAILGKPGPLDETERELMQRHPELGFAMTRNRLDPKVAEAVLYGGVVLLAGAAASRPWLPVVTAAGCSFLAVVGSLFGPFYPCVPLLLGVSNRLISLVAIWAPVAFIYQRRRAEVRLREANESLERRVDERTAALTTSEQALKRSQDALHALTGRILTAQE